MLAVTVGTRIRLLSARVYCLGHAMTSLFAKSLGLLLALAVFAFAAFSLQLNLSVSESPPNVGQAASDR